MSASGYEQYQHSADPSGAVPAKDPGDLPDQTGQAAVTGLGVAAPGPHPHEAADFRTSGQGDYARKDDPMEGLRDP